MWDLPARQPLTNLTIPDARVFVVFFSPGARFLNVGALSSQNRCLSRFWETSTWREVLSLDLAPHEFTGFGLAPDERTVGLGFSNGTAVWLDLLSGNRVTFTGRARNSVALAFSPNGRWFAASGVNERITLWDVATRRAQSIPRTERLAIDWLAFSPDSQRLVAASARPDGRVRLWDVESGNEVATLSGAPERRYKPVGFTPDGNSLYATTPWGPSVLWCASSWAEIEQEEQRTVGAPTPATW